jgi:hypothetical protein
MATMISMRALIVACALAFAVGLPRVARADDKTDAKQHYQDAEKAMADGKYDVAAEEYGAAYAIMKDPILFYKIGNANLLAGNCDAAVVYFKRYLAEKKPTDSSKEATEDKITQCEGGGSTGTTDTGTGTTGTTDTGAGDTGSGTGTGTGTGTGAEPDTGTGGGDVDTLPGSDDQLAPSFIDQKASWKRSVGWISMGVTVIFGTAGAILAMSSDSREQDVKALDDFRDPDGNPVPFEGNVSDRYETLVQEGERFNKLSEISFGVAGGALLIGATLLILDASSGHHNGESGSAIGLVPVVDHHGGGVAASLRF